MWESQVKSRFTKCLNLKKIKKDVTFTDYDESIISFDGFKIIPKAQGETFVTVNWNGYTDVFLVRVK